MTSMLFRSVTICSSLFKWYYLKNTTLFLSFCFHLWNLHQILNIFKEKKVLIANVFMNIQTLKYLLGPLSKKRRLRTSLTVNMLKGHKPLWNVHERTFIIFFQHSEGKWFGKISLLLKFEIIGVFVNILTVDYKHPIPDCENLLFPIQMQ